MAPSVADWGKPFVRPETPPSAALVQSDCPEPEPYSAFDAAYNAPNSSTVRNVLLIVSKSASLARYSDRRGRRADAVRVVTGSLRAATRGRAGRHGRSPRTTVPLPALYVAPPERRLYNPELRMATDDGGASLAPRSTSCGRDEEGRLRGACPGSAKTVRSVRFCNSAARGGRDFRPFNDALRGNQLCLGRDRARPAYRSNSSHLRAAADLRRPLPRGRARHARGRDSGSRPLPEHGARRRRAPQRPAALGAGPPSHGIGAQ